MAWLTRLLRARSVRRTRRWILSLDRAQLLALLMEDALLRYPQIDQQDCDGVVQLAFESYPDGHKDAIVNRLAEHLN